MGVKEVSGRCLASVRDPWVQGRDQPTLVEEPNTLKIITVRQGQMHYQIHS